MNKERKANDILELIPNNKLSSEQKSFRASKDKETFPFYKLIREPLDFDDLGLQKDSKLIIWRENGTLICIGACSFRKYEERKLFCWIYNNGDRHGSSCSIYGKSKAAIVETAMFFWLLKRSGRDAAGKSTSTLSIRECERFDITAFSPEQLAQISDANPTQELEIHAGTWSAAQSTVLANRSYPMGLSLVQHFRNQSSFRFADDGCAFVHALGKRQSSFGTLYMHWDVGYQKMPFSPENQRRLYDLDVFEKLTLRSLNDKKINLLPFLAKVNTLDYEMDANDIQPEDFDPLNIAAKDLRLKLCLSNTNDWDMIFVSLLNRLAQLGHLERLKLIPCWDEMDERRTSGFEDSESVAQAYIRVIGGNPKLSYLNIGNYDDSLDLEPHMNDIFKAMEEHKQLRTIIWKYISSQDASAFSALERLLTRNRNITVYNRWEEKITGPTIDKLYALNAFYNGSAALLKDDATAWRPPLVVTALTESASENFQYTALLLSNHTDVLCEFLGAVNLDSVTMTLKRTTGAEPAGPAQKEARKEK
jgi:hypothetical protein